MMTLRTHILGVLLCICFFSSPISSVEAQQKRSATPVRDFLTRLQRETDSLSSKVLAVFEPENWDWDGDDVRYVLEEEWRDGDLSLELQYRVLQFGHSVGKGILVPPPLSPVYRQEYYRLLQDEDPAIVLRTMDYFAGQLYFDEESPKIEAEFVRLMDHSNHEIAFKAIDVCVDFGIRFDLVLKKAFELLDEGSTVEKFKSSNFYVFVTVNAEYPSPVFICFDPHVRRSALRLIVRELASEVERRREFAADLLQIFLLSGEQDWSQLFDVLGRVDMNTASTILESQLASVPANQLLDLESDLQPLMVELKEKYQELFAQKILEQNPDSQEAREQVIQLIRNNSWQDFGFLENHGILPPGSTYYIATGILKQHAQLYALWKERHPHSVELMDRILARDRDANQFSFSQYGSFGYMNGRKKVIISMSELPFARQMLKFDHWTALRLFEQMGQPILTSRGPGRTGRHQGFEFFEIERHEDVTDAYPETVLDELDELFFDQSLPMDFRFEILQVLARSGRQRIEYLEFLKMFLTDDMRGREFDDYCRPALHLTAMLSPLTDPLAVEVMSLITEFHFRFDAQSSFRACLSADSFRSLFLYSSFEVINLMGHENDDWLVELANQYVKDLLDAQDAEQEWDQFCIVYLRSFNHKSQRAAEILWNEYVRTKPESDEEPELSWLTDNDQLLLAAINLSPDPRPYLDELTRLVDQHLRYWEAEDVTIVFPDDASLILEFLALFDREESWTVNLPFEQFAPLLNQIAIQALEQSEGVDDTFWLVSTYARLMLPYFEHRGSTNPLLETYRRRQHEFQEHYYYQGGGIYDDEYTVFNSLVEDIRLGRLSGVRLKPYLTRMERSVVIPMEIRAQAALTLSIIEPENLDHLDQITEILKTGFPLESKYHRAVRIRENAQ